MITCCFYPHGLLRFPTDLTKALITATDAVKNQHPLLYRSTTDVGASRSQRMSADTDAVKNTPPMPASAEEIKLTHTVQVQLVQCTVQWQ